ncbi:MAG: tetratricopeptide repeat protein [Cyclobacteriaceae bacterium]|nr:tetratricopeptide repeat protein [Cyclobacteriaceae bacterium]
MKYLVGISLAIALFACTGGKTLEGDSYYDTGQYDKALESYNKYLSLYPRNIKTLYNRARTYQKLDNDIMARQDLQKVLKLDPDHLQGRITLGEMEFQAGNYEKAFYEFDKAVSSHKQSSIAFAYRAKANQKLGKAKEALNDYSVALRLDAGNGMAYFYRATLYLSQKKKAAACSDFERAKELGISSADAAIKKYCK